MGLLTKIFQHFDAEAQTYVIHAPTTVAEGNAEGNAEGTKISGNKLRPNKLDSYIGQDKLKDMLSMQIKNAHLTNTQFPHTLVLAEGGKGKTALAHCIAAELGYHIETLSAPVHIQDLIKVAIIATEQYEVGVRTVLLVDEIHQQSKGKSADNGQEVLYHLMEDEMLDTDQGYIHVPGITILGATTHESMLAPSLKGRFGNKITLGDYTEKDLAEIVKMNADKLDLKATGTAQKVFSKASGGNPRQVNMLVRHASTIIAAMGKEQVDKDLALLVLHHKDVEEDGLTKEQVTYLSSLFDRKAWNYRHKEWIAKASVATMCQVMSRPDDPKYITDVIEPLLVKRGLVERVHGGRQITSQGLQRINKAWPPPVEEAA